MTISLLTASHRAALAASVAVVITALAPSAATAAAAAPHAATAAAAAPCVSSTAAATTLKDASGDGEGNAPDLTTITATVKPDCTVTVKVSVANRTRLQAADAVIVYLNTDGNTNTGAASFGGADKAVGLVTDEDGPGYLALLGPWDPRADAIDFERALELDTSSVNGGFGFTGGLDELGVSTGDVLGLAAVGLNEGRDTIALDFAPDDESLMSLPIAFTTTATAPTAPTTTSTPRDGASPESTSAAKPSTCRVPRLRGRTVTGARKALRAAGCRVGRTRLRYGTTVRPRRVVSTLPAAGTRISTARPVTILVAR